MPKSLLKVYYLDDEKDLLELFVDTFSTENYKISTFSEPAAFIAAVKHSPPDLVFLDYRLPGCTGDDMAKIIKPEIKKVLISGELDVQPREKFLAVIRKPCKPEEIQAILESCQEAKASRPT
jgi:DNA-binding NtrC family response regulator